ncbi:MULTISPECIES: KCU-star family selenoprotein [Helicobacter]|uniref:KCU-star family selenoprotein n=1 Tax=Helicobacter ibis TaxID=2962633 RepID=A0ABT4VDU6_9HELI|nr:MULTISPECIES: KCU-star family selenoprotein [Helicobacter]MDA3966520.1 KCU-star family selenoprotein [Helicobacter sp. WB40]MDA3968864.1 KCU-star family selenoprotein [Helicobacter ibis]
MKIKHFLRISFLRFVKIYQKSDRFLHLLVGMPSYDKYLEHMQKHHPDKIPKSQKEFFKEAMERKYGAGSSKC